MKALVLHGAHDVRVDTVPDPSILHPRDAVLRVTATAICGSDLHLYNGFFPQPRPMVLGHEFMGVVEEVGSQVSSLKRGDRVVVPFPIACGQCWFCEHKQPTQCETSNAKNYGPEGGLLKDKGGGLFGYTDLYGGYQGGQAQYVRVPFADYGPRKVPESLKDEEVLFLSDILPTGYTGLKWADVKPGETVAVWGCGPVGLMAQKLAKVMGAKAIGIDILEYRLARARETSGSTVIDATKTNPVEAVRELTGGRGADVCIEAIGMEAHRSPLKKLSNVLHAQAGTTDALEKCLSAVRRGGRVSVLGVYGTAYDNVQLGKMLDKGVRIQFGQAPVHVLIDELMGFIVDKKVRGDDIISHRLPLTEAPHGYKVFNDKKESCVKVVLNPWA
jgi:threonine dehydrogenase-like Zn-dependent dehydrogenase